MERRACRCRVTSSDNFKTTFHKLTRSCFPGRSQILILLCTIDSAEFEVLCRHLQLTALETHPASRLLDRAIDTGTIRFCILSLMLCVAGRRKETQKGGFPYGSSFLCVACSNVALLVLPRFARKPPFPPLFLFLSLSIFSACFPRKHNKISAEKTENVATDAEWNFLVFSRCCAITGGSLVPSSSFRHSPLILWEKVQLISTNSSRLIGF